MHSPTPLEQPLMTATTPRQITVGLPAAQSPREKRFPLTPEAAAILVSRGFTVKMEAGAAASIHFSDEAYSRHGVEIVPRTETLHADIVVLLAAISSADARNLKRGCLLLGLSPDTQSPDTLRILLQKSVTAIAIGRIADDRGHLPFADILHEIDGRAAIAIASSLLADSVHGKGILLGGVAGIAPCEVTVIGADLAAAAALRSAIGLGATVRLFDHDSYRLRAVSDAIGAAVITSVLHPRVLASALRSADIVIGCSLTRPFALSSDDVAAMKRGVITFDLASDTGAMFPSMPTLDLAMASPDDNLNERDLRVCYVNAGSAVPRTAAMALSNALLTLFDDIMACDSVLNALRIIPGLRPAACTFLGRPVSAACAKALGMRPVDINLLLQCS